MRYILLTAVCAIFVFHSAALAADNASDDFYNAIRRDDVTAVERLLKTHGANLLDNRGSTPLMYAAAVGSEAMMRRLIEAGADAKIKNSLSASALHWCGGSFSRMRLLVDHGADVNLRSKQGHTPILLAASQAGGLSAVEMLLAKGATFGGPPAANGMTPLAAATGANDTALVKFLLEKGGAAILAPPGGAMAIINAASFGNIELVKLLLAKGVDVNSTSPPETGRVKNGPIGIGSLTPLILSVASGDAEMVRTLLKAGAKINAWDVRGMTPLMLAVATDHPNRDIVKLLIEEHADTKIKSKADETALDWALKFKDESIMAAVRTASPGIEPAKHEMPPLNLLAAPNALASVQKSVSLLQKSADANFKEGGCVSCHAGNISTSAVAAARRKGIAVDEAAAAATIKATRLQFAGPAEGLLERSDLPAVEIMTFALAALADEGAQPDRTTDALLHNIAAHQLAPGHWPYRGIMRPPTGDHVFTNAAYSIRAFRLFAPPARKSEYNVRIAQAAKALEAATPSTTEDAVMRMLGIHWAGKKVDSLRKSVLALQRKDGGWGQTPLLPSDAYATGTALHALFECGILPESAEYKKGTKFLLDTQAADGSWHVVSRAPKFQPYFEGGFPYGHDQWISQWSTGWATLALAHTVQ